jgi:hypothetical protein
VIGRFTKKNSITLQRELSKGCGSQNNTPIIRRGFFYADRSGDYVWKIVVFFHRGFFYTYPLILFLDTNMDQDFLIHHELSQVLIHLI